MEPNQEVQKNNSKKGFASMTVEQRRAIASAGGISAHKNGRAHKFDSEKAREAGRKGGRAVSVNREHMAMIGQRGGEKRSKNASLKNGQPAEKTTDTTTEE